MKRRFNFFTFGLDDTNWETYLELPQKLVKSDFARKVMETFATRIFLMGVGFLTSAVIARILEPDGRGLFATAMNVGAIGTQFGNLGLHASNTYYVAKQRSLLPTLVANSLVVSFGLGGALVLALGLFFSFFPSLAPVRGLILWIGLLWIPFSLAYLLFQNLLLGVQDVRSFNKIEIATKLFSVFLMGSLIFCKAVTVENVLWANLLAQVVGFLWVFTKVYGNIKERIAPSLTLFKENISYGLRAYWVALFSFLVIRVDLLMVKYMKGAEQTGYYSVATTLADLLFMLPMITGSILFPKLSAMSSKEAKWRFVRKAAWGMAGLLLLLVMAAGALSNWLTPLVYGEKFRPSIAPFLWLLPGIYFLGIEVIAVQFLNSVGFPKRVLWNWAFVTLLNVGLNLLWIPRWGIMGASLSSSLSYFVIFCLILLTIRKVLREDNQ